MIEIMRVLAVVIGSVMLVHFLFMANFANPKSPIVVGVLLGMIAGSGAGLTISGINGDIGYMWMFSLISAGSILVLWLWLWAKGMHVCDFLNQKYGRDNHPA